MEKAQQGKLASTSGTLSVIVFTVLDPQGYDISLDSEAWDHILEGHPEMVDHVDRLKETLLHPQVIQRESDQSETHYYYRLTERSFSPTQDVYINAVVRRTECSKSGSVKTAFIVKTIRKQGELVWMNVKN
jgi:hypothetical protein